MKKLLLCIFILLICGVYAETLSSSYDTGWSRWNSVSSGRYDEVSRTFYRWRTVSSWSACDAAHTSKPADFYWEGTYSYDPYNCPGSAKSCTWTCTQDLSPTSNPCGCGINWGHCHTYSEVCDSHYTEEAGDHGCNRSLCKTKFLNDAVCIKKDSRGNCILYSDGTNIGHGSKVRSCPTKKSRGDCIDWYYYTSCSQSGTNADKCGRNNDGPCGNKATATCYMVPTGWNNWSAWNDTDKSGGKCTQVNSKCETDVQSLVFYSYPEDVRIKFEGNGTDKLCPNSSFNTSGGDLSACSVGTVTGKMSDQVVRYNSARNIDNKIKLSSNLYVREGYNFKGWEVWVEGGKTRTIYAENVNGTAAAVNKINSLSFNVHTLAENVPGRTVIMKAIWEKRTYEIRYHLYCGNTSNANNYQLGNVINLSAPNLDECKLDNKSQTNAANSTTKFEGWYRDPNYMYPTTSVSSNEHSDLDIYAKLKQARYFDYSNGGKWSWMSNVG